MYGGVYMMTKTITQSLLNAIDSTYSGPILDLEDVFITGILPQSLGISRYSKDFFKYINWNGKGCFANMCEAVDPDHNYVVFGCVGAEDISDTYLTLDEQDHNHVINRRLF